MKEKEGLPDYEKFQELLKVFDAPKPEEPAATDTATPAMEKPSPSEPAPAA